jgi:hypothetical protein
MAAHDFLNEPSSNQDGGHTGFDYWLLKQFLCGHSLLIRWFMFENGQPSFVAQLLRLVLGVVFEL